MKKVLINLLIVIVAIIVMSTNMAVQAVGFKLNATSNATTVKPGDEITITLAVSDVDLGENGMNTLEGTLDYNRDIFEEVKSSDIATQNGWIVTYNDEATGLNGKFLATKTGEGVKENQTLATIKLKVKENVSNQTTSVTIKDIATNDGTNLVEETNKQITIKIETPSTNSNPSGEGSGSGSQGGAQGGSQGSNGSGKNDVNTAGSGNTNNNNTNKATTGTNNKNTSKTNTSLPKTGVNDTIIVVGIVVIILTGIISYVKYKEYKGM